MIEIYPAKRIITMDRSNQVTQAVAVLDGRILGTIHIYPTMAEANKYAAGDRKRAHAPQKLLAWVEKFHDWRRG